MYKSLRQILGTGTHTQRCCRCERASWNDDAWNGCSQKSTRCKMLQQKLLHDTCLQTGAPKKTKHRPRIRNEEDRVSSAVDCPRGLKGVPEASRHQRTFTSRKRWPHEVVKTDLEGNQVRIFPPNDCDEQESRERGVWQLQLSLFPSVCSPFAGKY